MDRQGFESFYSFFLKDIAFHRARLELKHYHKISGPIVMATRLASSITTPKSLKQFYMGDTRRRLHRPVTFQSRERSSRVQNQVTDTTLHAIHFLEFVAPVRGFLPNTRNGSRYVAANLEFRIPLSRLTKFSLPGNALYNLEIIPFIDAGTAWEDGNPFSQKKPTDTHYIASGPLTIKLQTLKSPLPDWIWIRRPNQFAGLVSSGRSRLGNGRLFCSATHLYQFIGEEFLESFGFRGSCCGFRGRKLNIYLLLRRKHVLSQMAVQAPLHIAVFFV